MTSRATSATRRSRGPSSPACAQRCGSLSNPDGDGDPMHISIDRAARWIAVAVTCLCFAGCNTDKVLKVEFPGQIPTDQINDPTLAPVLVRSVIGDFECAYSNYMSGSSVHSDEYETANSN